MAFYIPSVSEYVKERWPMVILLGIFIIFKIPHLFYPYYWDESWPYTPAIFQMYHHGISVLPGAVIPELSRGHPLLFHALCALWMNIFGRSHVALHSFALTISVVTLISVYEVGYRLFDKRVAFLVCFLLSAQMLFYIQSAFLLPEIFLANLCFLSLYFYVTKQYIASGICLTAAFYTKESGLIAGFVIGINAVVALFSNVTSAKEKVFRLLTVAVPVGLFGIFFILQKHLYGWYIFPLHVDSLAHSLDGYLFELRLGCIRDILITDNRYYYVIMLGVLGVAAAIKTKSPLFLGILIPFFSFWCMIDDARTVHCNILVLILSFFIGIIIVVFFLDKLKYYSNSKQRHFVTICFCFFMVFILYSAATIFSSRYLLCALIPLLFIMAVFLNFCISKANNNLYFLLIPIGICIACASYYSNNSLGDGSRNAFYTMKVEQDAINYCERNNLFDKHLATPNFLSLMHFTEPGSGYLSSPNFFQHVQFYKDSITEYVVLPNLNTDNSVMNDSTYEIVYESTSKDNSETWEKVYKRKHIFK